MKHRTFWTSCLLVSLVICHFAVQAQPDPILRVGSQDEVKEAKTRPLLLMLAEEDPKVLVQYQRKPRELESYRETIKRMNEGLQTAVTKFWTFSAQPAIKTKAEVDKLIAQKSKAYCVMSTRYDMFQSYETRSTVDAPNVSKRYLSAVNEIISVRLDVIEEVGKPNPVYYQNTPNLYPSDGDMAIVMMVMQNAMQSRLDGKKPQAFWNEVDQNKLALPDKTLLLDKNQIKVSEEEIRSVYPHPFRVVDYEMVEKAILERDPGFALVQIVPMKDAQFVFVHMVVNASDGKILATYSPFQPPKPGAPRDIRIGTEHLKGFLK